MAGGTGDDEISGGADADTFILWDAFGTDTITGGETVTAGTDDDRLDFSPLTAGIDVTYTGDGVDTIADFNAGNTGTLSDGDSTNNDFIDLSAFYDSIWELHADQADDGVLNQSNDGVGGVDYSDNTRFGAGSLTFAGASADGTSFAAENTGVVCFARHSDPDPGRRDAVERLRPGHRVVTADHGVQAIRWIGSRRVARMPALQPIRISAGALGPGVPARTLYLSPQHRLVLRSRIVARMTGAAEALVAAKKFARVRGIHSDTRRGHVRDFHILCDAHEIVFANGVPAETLLPGPGARAAMGDEAGGELTAIFPEIADTLAHDAAARLIVEGPRRARLIDRHRRNEVPLV